MINKINALHNFRRLFKGSENVVFSFESEVEDRSFVRFWNRKNQFHVSKNLNFEIDNYKEFGSQYYVTDDEHNCYVSKNQYLSELKVYSKDFFIALSHFGIINEDCYSLGYSYSDDYAKKYYKVINLKNDKEIYKSKNQLHILGGYIIERLPLDSKNKTKVISCRNLIDHQMIWEYDLWQHGSFSSFAIKKIDNNYIIVYTDLFKFYFNLKTGELVWKSDDYLLRYAKPNYNGQKLISFNQGYVEFDLKTGERKIDRNARDKYPNFGSGSPYFWHSGDVIITVDSRKNRIYFYDIIQDEMIYVHEEKEAKPYLTAKPIYYHDGHVFVKTFDTNILFVYEVDKLLKDKLEKQSA